MVFKLRRGFFLSFSLSDTPHYENVPFEVPEGWMWTTLGVIGTWQSGGTPSRSNKDVYKRQQIEYVKITVFILHLKRD